MRRPARVKSVFLLPSCEFLAFELNRLCRHPSIRTLWLSDFCSVQVGRPHFSRCCYVIIDLGSLLFDESWAVFTSNSRPRRSPRGGCSAVVHRPLRSPTTCEAVRPTSVLRQRWLASWHSFLLWRECERRFLELGEGLEGLPLGYITGETYNQQSVRLNHGDMILAFSDGATEVQSPAGEQLDNAAHPPARGLVARPARRATICGGVPRYFMG
jgi:hypothetical protein